MKYLKKFWWWYQLFRGYENARWASVVRACAILEGLKVPFKPAAFNTSACDEYSYQLKRARTKSARKI
jgi:hypothetical protein